MLKLPRQEENAIFKGTSSSKKHNKKLPFFLVSIYFYFYYFSYYFSVPVLFLLLAMFFSSLLSSGRVISDSHLRKLVPLKMACHVHLLIQRRTNSNNVRNTHDAQQQQKSKHYGCSVTAANGRRKYRFKALICESNRMHTKPPK